MTKFEKWWENHYLDEDLMRSLCRWQLARVKKECEKAWKAARRAA